MGHGRHILTARRIVHCGVAMRSWHGSLYISDSVLIDVFRAHLKVCRKAAHMGKQHSNYLGRECAKDQIDVWKFKGPAILALETIDAS